MKLVAIILTYNETAHLARCVTSVRAVTNEIVVVDCFSTDGTARLATSMGLRVLQHEWVNHAAQFNWALTQLDPDTDWVLRIDADEYLSRMLITDIRERLITFPQEVEGVYCDRRMTFQRQLVRRGGVFPIRVLRLFRFGKGKAENRWMDEHIIVRGATANLKGEIIDDNLNSLTSWTAKHNGYSSRDAIDLLNLKYRFMSTESIADVYRPSRTGLKRWIKERLYARLPGGFRAFAYFFYRFVIRLGFLDGRSGISFHILQGFWYRYLVDAKVTEVEQCMCDNRCNAVEAIERVLGIKVEP